MPPPSHRPIAVGGETYRVCRINVILPEAPADHIDASRRSGRVRRIAASSSQSSRDALLENTATARVWAGSCFYGLPQPAPYCYSSRSYVPRLKQSARLGQPYQAYADASPGLNSYSIRSNHISSSSTFSPSVAVVIIRQWIDHPSRLYPSASNHPRKDGVRPRHHIPISLTSISRAASRPVHSAVVALVAATLMSLVYAHSLLLPRTE
ncbi:hypothetical protein F5Y12DRAFT_713652 [Xylaria sp. FL1777]|nr:hypothetical protein F5Y12DRAFT_713652 [Xylaria sp. FL1777]